MGENGYLKKLIYFFLVLLILSCVFDPGNKILGLKMHFFILSWITFIFWAVTYKHSILVSRNLFIYLILFIFIIPCTSIIYFFLLNGTNVKFDGLIYYRTLLFITLVIILYHSRINLLFTTIKILTILSFITIVLFIIGYFNNSFFTLLEKKIGGMKYDLARIGFRNYSGFQIPMLYFESSPLIVFAIGYFAYRFSTSEKSNKLRFFFLLMLNIFGMFVGSTRNNIFASILTPIVVIYMYSRKKVIILASAILLLGFITINNIELIQKFFDKNETSNQIKISFFQDYLELLSKPGIFFFGQGMGSYFESVRGLVSNSELTYLEIFRRYGLFLSMIFIGLLTYPLLYLFYKKYYTIHYIFISYFFYLVMCFSNPMLLSSTGMLFLSLILYVTSLKTES